MLNTIGVDFVTHALIQKVKYVDKNGQRLKIVLVIMVVIQWDTAGQERFRTITNGYYRGADGILIVYDLTDRDSFENVNMWYEEMSRSVNQKVVCILIGNKLDMDSRRVVSTEEGKRLGTFLIIEAQKYGIPFAETSAKSGQNVNQIFDSLVERVIVNNENKPSSRPKLKPPQPLTQNRNKEEQYCSCCGN